MLITATKKIGRKIRDAEVNKIPFMFIVGEKEEESKTVSIRKQGQGDAGSFSQIELITLMNDELKKSMSQEKS